MTDIYELSSQLKKIQSLDVDNETMENTIEAINGCIQEKVVGLAKCIKNIDSSIDGILLEIDRLKKRVSLLKSRRNNIKTAMICGMTASNISSVNSDLFTISIVSGRDVVIIDSDTDLPDEFVDVDVIEKPKKNEIRLAINSGRKVPGAHIEKSKPSVRIK